MKKILASFLFCFLCFSSFSYTIEEISLDSSWPYASYSKINSGFCKLYKVNEDFPTVCINAGHGTIGGNQVKTQTHPDGTPKYLSGSTTSGAVESTAVSLGMTFKDGTPEPKANLGLALLVKDELIKMGYNVLMIRESDDVQLDNIARTVIANNKANCHVAIHYDSTDTDKGAFYIKTPEIDAYRNMEPVSALWPLHHELGDSIINAFKKAKVKLYPEDFYMDLTQTSYSTIPSVDLEIGDAISDISYKKQKKIAIAMAQGISRFFKEAL